MKYSKWIMSGIFLVGCGDLNPLNEDADDDCDPKVYQDETFMMAFEPDSPVSKDGYFAVAVPNGSSEPYISSSYRGVFGNPILSGDEVFAAKFYQEDSQEVLESSESLESVLLYSTHSQPVVIDPSTASKSVYGADRQAHVAMCLPCART